MRVFLLRGWLKFLERRGLIVLGNVVSCVVLLRFKWFRSCYVNSEFEVRGYLEFIDLGDFLSVVFSMGFEFILGV